MDIKSTWLMGSMEYFNSEYKWFKILTIVNFVLILILYVLLGIHALNTSSGFKEVRDDIKELNKNVIRR